MTDRQAMIQSFLADAGWGKAELRPLADDASFRRYFRLRRGSGRAVLMDAPPPRENVAAFHRVQSLLGDLGYSAPRPLALDLKAGLMLLEDLGDRTFTRALAEGMAEAPLYRLAVDLLSDLQRRFQPKQGVAAGLPSYDEAKLLEEAALLTDWYLPAIGRPPSATERDVYLAACGLLDFQDAVIGPVTYDLVSLLEDVRRDVTPALVKELKTRYLAAMPGLDPAAFAASYAIMGAQRNAKIVGIFTRLCRRDGKAHYLRHIPRTWRLLEGDLAHPALAPVRAWLDAAIPPGDRIVPQGEAAE